MNEFQNLGYQLSLMNQKQDTGLTGEYVGGNMFSAGSVPYNWFLTGWEIAREEKKHA